MPAFGNSTFARVRVQDFQDTLSSIVDSAARQQGGYRGVLAC